MQKPLWNPNQTYGTLAFKKDRVSIKLSQHLPSPENRSSPGSIQGFGKGLLEHLPLPVGGDKTSSQEFWSSLAGYQGIWDKTL